MVRTSTLLPMEKWPCNTRPQHRGLVYTRKRVFWGCILHQQTPAHKITWTGWSSFHRQNAIYIRPSANRNTFKDKKESKHKKQGFLRHLATVIRFSLPSLHRNDLIFLRPHQKRRVMLSHSSPSYLQPGRTWTHRLPSQSRSGEEQSTQTKTMLFFVNERLSWPLPEMKKGNVFSRRINSDFSIRNNKYFPRYGRQCIFFLGWH